MTMSARSAKNKGLRFENHLQELFREGLDKNAHVNKASGAGLNKGDLRIPSFQMNVEAKNAEVIHLITDWEQTKEQCTGDDIPILAIRNPKKPEFQETLIVMEINDWMELVKNSKEEIEITKTFAREDMWLVRQTIENLKKCLKTFGE